MQEKTVAKSLAPKSIPAFPDTPAEKYLDFDFLRAEGLGHIQNLSGKIWTDHNIHDPGFTILEELCYALTDLGYRLHLPDEDLLAPNPEKAKAEGDDNFFSAAEILSSNPLTILDWRKLLLDVRGVQNAWIEPIETWQEKQQTGNRVRNELWEKEAKMYADLGAGKLTLSAQGRLFTSPFPGLNKPVYPVGIRGVYKVLLELEPTLSESAATTDRCNPSATDAVGETLAEVTRRLQTYRNLCEDFLPVQVLVEEPVSLCAEIELEANAQPDDVLFAIFERLQAFFSPSVQFYSLQQLLEGDTLLGQKRTVEEAFEGRPLLSEGHGFIDTEELEQIERRSEIHVSDIYKLILGDGLINGLKPIEGVSAIQSLRLINQRTDNNQTGEEWILPLTDGFHPVLAARESVGSVTFYKRGVRYKANTDRVLARFEKRILNPTKVFKSRSGKTGNVTPPEFNLPVPTGIFRSDLGDHHSIQHDFPRAYGVGEGTLTDAMLPERWHQALQLKGYLLFYDHLLANFLVRIANIRSYFSRKADRQAGFGESVGNLDSVPLLSAVLPFFKNSGDLAAESPSAAQILKYLKKGADEKENIPLATALKSYATPQDRDHALAHLIAAFDMGNIHYSTQYEAKKDLYFLIYTAAGNQTVALRSVEGFPTETKALQKASMWNFMGSLPSSYEKINDARHRRYSFRLLNNPPSYQDYLSGLEESDADFYRKKNLLQDHLLHRFSEDFTDYTLLMFAMSKTTGGADVDELALHKRFVEDKARFLENYPDISRNRSKGGIGTGTRGKEKSGLEKRVSSLIGIDTERDTHSLNFFETLPQTITSVFEIRDRDQTTVLLRSVKRFTDVDAARQAKAQALLYGADIQHYQPVECLVEQVYGFKLLDDQGCPIAEHPETFGSALRRDQKMLYVAGAIAGDGIVSGFEANTQGSFFEIFNEDKDIILRAASAAPDQKAALKEFLNFAQQAASSENWRDIDDPAHRGYSFAVFGYADTDATMQFEKIPLAVHPVFYQSADSRNKQRDKAKIFAHKRHIGWKALQQRTRYRWQICDSLGIALLESLHFFRKKRQTAKAVHEALMALLQPSSAATIEIEDLGSAGWTFYVLQKTNYLEDDDQEGVEHPISVRIAAPPQPFVSRMACEAAVRYLKEVALALDDCDWTLHQSQTLTADEVWEKLSTSEGSARLIRDRQRYRLAWYNALGELGLTGDKSDFESSLDALASVFELGEPDAAGSSMVTDLATRQDAFFDTIENEGCAFGFGMAETNPEARAEHPDLFIHKTDQEQAKSALWNEATQNAWAISINQVIESYAFQVSWESCDGRLEVMLRGAQKFPADPDTHDLPQAAQDAYKRLLEKADEEVKAAKETNFEVFGAGTSYSFRVNTREKGQKILLAQHPHTYRTEAEARRARLKALEYLTLRKAFAVSDPLQDNICACPTDEGALRNQDARNWRLANEEERVARYTLHFESEQGVRHCIDRQTARCSSCSKPDYSVVWENEDSVVQEGIGGGYRFIIRDATECYWQSVALFDTENEARAALDVSLIRIMDAARDLTRYHIRQENAPAAATSGARKSIAATRQFVIELMPNEGKVPLAESYEKPRLVQQLSGLTAKLHRHALRFPLTFDPAIGQIRFQVFNLSQQSIEWQSLAGFDTKQIAEDAFTRFLDLLKDERHYRISENCNKKWNLELVETLLQGTELFFTKTEHDFLLSAAHPPLNMEVEKAATHFAWQRVDGFLEQLARAGKGAFVPTVDYLNCCGYGFKLAGEHYRLARHTRSYHTRAERERARDQLVGWWNCLDKTGSENSSAIVSRLQARASGFFDLRDYTCTLSGADNQTYEQTNYKVRLYADAGKTDFLFEYPSVFAEAVQIDEHGNILPINEAKNDARQDALGEQERLKEEAIKILLTLGNSEVLENLTVLTDFEEIDTPAPGTRKLVLQLAVNLPDGELLAVLPEWTASDLETMKSELKALYCWAMKSEIVQLPNGKYGFEFRRPVRAVRRYVRGFTDPQHYMPVGFAVPEFEVVWENIRHFDSLEEAAEQAEKVRSLLAQKSNYGRSTDAFGSATLEIVNPDALLAVHPRTYATREARDRAWQKVQQYIHTEGMHLMEHIFLRPRRPDDDALLPIILDSDDIKEFKSDNRIDPYAVTQYVEGADPYSFVATIILPAWSQRLRDLEFRIFFENTLRREAPAHVLLRLFWLRPEDMFNFERQYQAWLPVADMPDHVDFTCRKQCLIDALNELRDAYPDAVLAGCEAGSTTFSGVEVALDSTTLN